MLLPTISLSTSNLKPSSKMAAVTKGSSNRAAILYNRTTESLILTTRDELSVDGELGSLFRSISFPRLTRTLAIPGTRDKLTIPLRIWLLRNITSSRSFNIVHIGKMVSGDGKRCRAKSAASEKKASQDLEDYYERNVEWEVVERVVLKTGIKGLDEFEWSVQLESIEESIEEGTGRESVGGLEVGEDESRIGIKKGFDIVLREG